MPVVEWTRQVQTQDDTARVDGCRELAAEVQHRVAEPVGLLRLTAPTLYGRRFLAPVIAEYLGRFQDARVEVMLADRVVNLVEEGLHLAIRVGEGEYSSFVARKLGEAYVYCVASPRFLRTHGTLTPAALRTARCIGVKPHETWTAGGVVSKIEPVLVANDLEIACEAAIAGVGVARVPALLCGEVVRARKLRVLFGAEPAYVRPVFAVYPSRQYLPPKVRLFVDALARLVAPMQPLKLRE